MRHLSNYRFPETCLLVATGSLCVAVAGAQTPNCTADPYDVPAGYPTAT